MKKAVKKVSPGKASKSGKLASLLKKATAKKSAPVKKVAAKKAPAKKAAPVKKAVAKKAPVKKATAKKVAAKKSAPVKKAAPARSPNIVKPQLAKKKAPIKALPAKLQSTTTGNSTTISVAPREVNNGPEVVVEERRLVMPPPPRPIKAGKKIAPLKPIKGAPAPLIVEDSEASWSASELKAMRTELSKDLTRLKAELAEAEGEMEDLIVSAGVGAGDDQADAGTKTFEREHEMSLVYNARDMVLQTERAIDRIDTKSYGRCEECSSPIGKARLQVFPRATLCMACKQKEERR